MYVYVVCIQGLLAILRGARKKILFFFFSPSVSDQQRIITYKYVLVHIHVCGFLGADSKRLGWAGTRLHLYVRASTVRKNGGERVHACTRYCDNTHTIILLVYDWLWERRLG